MSDTENSLPTNSRSVERTDSPRTSENNVDAEAVAS